MTLNVQAQVVDIRNDSPKQRDKFLVDTNVWLSLYYNRTTTPASTNRVNSYVNNYFSYIEKVRHAMSTLLYCGFSLAEIAHVVEKREKEAFSDEVGLKEYRSNYPEEREKVVRKVKNIWSNINRTAISVDLLINKDVTLAALTIFETQLLDGYDLFIIKAMREGNIDKIITDDVDFITVPNITVFTANNTSIDAARQQKKLVRRER